MIFEFLWRIMILEFSMGNHDYRNFLENHDFNFPWKIMILSFSWGIMMILEISWRLII